MLHISRAIKSCFIIFPSHIYHLSHPGKGDEGKDSQYSTEGGHFLKANVWSKTQVIAIEPDVERNNYYLISLHSG